MQISLIYSGSFKSWFIKNEWNIYVLFPKRIEYILEGNLLEKSVKRPFCYVFHFTNDMIFRYKYKSNDVFYSPNSFKSLFNSFKKFEIEMDSLGNILY